MRVARKRPQGVAAAKKRHKKTHALVLDSYEVLEDGTHVVVIPVHTRNFGNVQGPNSQIAGILRRREQTAQRVQCKAILAKYDVPTHFRGVRMVRLAPSNTGLDTGGIWNALKAPQDGVADHLGIDDGPRSPATWVMDQEYSKAYGVRVELKEERSDGKG